MHADCKFFLHSAHAPSHALHIFKTDVVPDGQFVTHLPNESARSPLHDKHVLDELQSLHSGKH